MSTRRRTLLLSTPLLVFVVLAGGCGPAAPPAETGAGDAKAADPEEEAAVLDVIQRFFDALEHRDAEALAATLSPDASVHAVLVTPDQPVRVGGRPASEDIEWLSETTDRMLERMWDADVRIHGPIAMVWTPYDFWRNGAFSHCGVDIFTLVRGEEGWKISAATYTAEMEGCAESPLGPPTAQQLGEPS